MPPDEHNDLLHEDGYLLLHGVAFVGRTCPNEHSGSNLGRDDRNEAADLLCGSYTRTGDASHLDDVHVWASQLGVTVNMRVWLIKPRASREAPRRRPGRWRPTRS